MLARATTVRFALFCTALVPIAAFSSGPASAQTSPGFRLEEHQLNMGGRPAGGASAASATFRITFDALGEQVRPAELSGPSFSLNPGLATGYAPPGEVLDLVFSDDGTLDWAAEPSARFYHVYRDTLTNLSDTYAGSCAQQDLSASTTTDPATPAVGTTWFYLVTAENRLGVEGTRGRNASGQERPATGSCP